MAGSGGTLTWSTTSVTLAVGETITVNYTTTFNQVDSDTFAPLIASVATFTRGTGKIDLTGTAAGTVTIAANTTVSFETVTTNALTITVTSADDQNFLNERGLARFWDNIDDIKQNKLTAGAGISITNDVISATGGGVADSVAWGHITGSMSNQTDLTTALAAKANSADLATVATTGDYSDLSGTPTIPTVNDAVLTITQRGSTLGTFTANASSAKTINVTAPYCDGLYGQAQTAAYRRSVIALCEVTTTGQSSKNSWFCGRIAFHRDNGLSGVEVVNINMENQYYKAYYTNVSYYSNFTVLSSTASKDTAIGWRPCTFKYNNVYYGGIEICTNIANNNIIWYETIGNFTPFGVDYYSMPHDSTASSVLNSEINNSINFTQWDATYNQWHMGQAKRDIIYNNASGTNANFSTTSAMSNYDEVEISYRDGNNNYEYKTIPGAAGSFVLDISHPGASGIVYWYISRFIVSGTSITVGANNVRKVISTSISSTTSQDIYITRMIGIKY